MPTTLASIETIFTGSEQVSLSSVIDRFGPESFLVLIFILIAPNLIPFLSQFGIAEATSGMVALLSLQLITGREIPWLPKKIAAREMPVNRVAVVGDRIFPVLRKLDLLTSPRLIALSSEKTYRIYGVMFFILSTLILLPLPFFNYAPAVVIMLSIIGLLSRDGIFLLLGISLFSVIMIALSFAILAAM